MPRARKYLLAATSILALVANSAASDVSAVEVWENWRDQLSISGENHVVIGNLSQSGKRLTVEGIELRQGSDDASSLVEISEMTFTENGDGTVTVTLPNLIPITFSPNDDPEGNHIEMALMPVNASMIVGGTAEAMTFDFTADRITLSASELVENGDVVPADILFNANGLSSHWIHTAGDMKDISYALDARSFEVLIGIDDGSGRIDLSGRASDISATASGRMPNANSAGSMADFRDQGGHLSANFSSGPSTVVLAVNQDGEATDIVLGSAGNRFDMNITAESIAMGSESTDLTIGLAGDALPFPINLTARTLGQSFTFPVLATEGPMPMGMSLNVHGLALDDKIWAMLDPFGAVPHEPLTLQYTIDGTARLRYDLSDSDRIQKVAEGETPFEVFSANISGLRLAFAGAELTGEGAFTFDNADTDTFPGMPRPQGHARLEAVGLNSMFDRLAAVGLLPEEQLMGFRMMLGMFADVIGDDHLVSEVEINPTGQIFLNGQRLR